MFDTHKTRMIGVRCGEKNYDNTSSCFHRIPERDVQTDGPTDRQTELPLLISRVSVLTRDKNIRGVTILCVER